MSADVDGASAVTVVERVDQYVIDAWVVIRLDELRVGPLMTYLAGGSRYLRRLHDGLAVIEESHVYHLGGSSLNDGTTPHGSFSAGVLVKF